jgi:hypothetical protein
MSEQLDSAIIAALVGLVTGAAGSLVAPWVGWGIEKRRKLVERRINLFEYWKSVLSRSDFDCGMLLSDPNWGALRPLLTADALKQIERPCKSHQGYVRKLPGWPTRKQSG